MEEKALKTTWKQRLVIGFIAFLLLASTVAIYALIVLGGDNVDYAKMTSSQLEKAYEETYAKYNETVSELSSQYLDELSSYKTHVKAYNSTTANSDGVTQKDLKEGEGEPIGNEYSAYYIGWCADETIFDSSFDNFDEPTALKAPIAVTPDSLIEGWYLGVDGMKYGGVREVTIPGPLAYGDSQEICGSKNSPLKFIILPIEKNQKLEEQSEEITKIYTALQQSWSQSYSDYSSQQQIDYDSYAEETESSGE